MRVSIQSLRVFLSILEEGSLSAAGRELKMTQPAVSNHLHLLEKRFGVALVVRGRPLRSTCAGECLAERAGRILAELEGLEEEMARHTEPRGHLVVGASSTPGEIMLPKLATEFAARYPDVALDVRVNDTEGIVAAVKNREIEVGIVGREVVDDGLETVVIGQDELVLVVASGDRLADTKVSVDELRDQAFVLREDGSATRRAAEDVLTTAGISPRIAMELGSNAAVAGAVAAGAGVGIVPARLAGSQLSVRRVETSGLSFRRPFVLVMERDRQLSPAAQAFAEICIEKADD